MKTINFSLLTDSARQLKTGKSRSIEGLKDYWVVSLELTPNARTCPYAFAKGLECTNGGRGCLNTSGNGRFDTVQNARNRRTDLWFNDRDRFLILLKADLAIAQAVAVARGDRLAVRLDTFSSLHLWHDDRIYDEIVKPLQDQGAIFYDYIKAPLARIKAGIAKGIDLTVSFTEQTTPKKLDEYMKIARVAVVFDGEVPDYWNGYRVINGDDHDLRFTEPLGVVIGLTSKVIAGGKKRAENSNGFVQIGVTKAQRSKASDLFPAMAPSVSAMLYA
tara:strand:+ start:1118 stop:1942 length:825 start_codon:yes stop_codon:yes gene_type:complete